MSVVVVIIVVIGVVIFEDKYRSYIELVSFYLWDLLV